MQLKPKAAPFILAIIGGMFFIWFSVGIMLSFGEFFWFLAILTAFGGALSLFGVHIFRTRKHRLLIIDSDGITLTQFETSYTAPASEIAIIREFANLRGRGIQVEFKSGEITHLDCRHYCTPRQFLKHCHTVGLPCA